MEKNQDTQQKQQRIDEAAQRALQEARARETLKNPADTLALELGGRDGPEPVRYGDWEKKGIAYDF